MRARFSSKAIFFHDMSDRTTEPGAGPSEQPPETGHPSISKRGGSHCRQTTSLHITVMDVDEEQPEDEASQPPRKRGRF